MTSTQSASRFTRISANFQPSIVTRLPSCGQRRGPWRSVTMQNGRTAMVVSIRSEAPAETGRNRMAASLGHLWSALPDLAIEARARSSEFEERRRLAPDFVDKLKRAGACKILIPADAGGLGGSLPQLLE